MSTQLRLPHGDGSAQLVLDFERRGDRYAHRVIAVAPGGGPPIVLVESVEGDREPWPPSPPLQELHVEQRGTASGPPQQVALLVGRAGKSHWSAGVTLDPAAGTVTWEVACRTDQTPQRLASTYRSAADVCPTAGPDLILLVAGRERFALECLPTGDGPSAARCGDGPAIAGSGDGLAAAGSGGIGRSCGPQTPTTRIDASFDPSGWLVRLSPAETGGTGPRTYCWTYRLRPVGAGRASGD